MANRYETVESRIARLRPIGEPDDCWPWLGSKNQKGYGVMSVDGHHHPAHRVVYQLEVGPIPDGLTIDHLCRVRACCNPKHLEPVTIGENVRRGDTVNAANLRKTHCPRGHVLDARLANGDRYCRTCSRARNRRWYQANLERERARKRVPLAELSSASAEADGLEVEG